MISSRRLLVGFILCTLFSVATRSQSTTFTYQGKLADGGVAANGTYDLTFKLYDTLASGTQIGIDIVRDNVVVTDGEFTVDLDFGAAAFETGASRFLQLEVRSGASTGTFTALVPRQPVTSLPYGIKAINATTADSLSASCVSCVTDANINSVSSNKVTGVLDRASGGTGLGASGAAGNFLRSDGMNWTSSPFQASDIPVLSTSFIQNIPGIGTQSASFNIDGGGNANIFNATTQYNIGGNRVLSAAGTNLIAGIDTGTLTTGFDNSFFGRQAGQASTTAASNSFFGTFAGRLNNGDFNAFFGARAGQQNITGQRNSFFGFGAGGLADSSANSFFGDSAGSGNTSGSSNTFFGVNAGDTNTTGNNNTIIGTDADVSSNNLTNATAIGAGSIVSQSNSLVLGRSLDTVRVPGNLNVAGTFTGSFTVPAANGGTGLGSSGATGNVLRSNGSVWTSSALQASDIPNLNASYIQNQDAVTQSSSNFAISGNGTAGGSLSANVVNSATQYNIGNNRILSVAGNFNLFVGNSAGPFTTGSFNSMIGGGAGFANTTGAGNVIIGALAGDANTTGSNNTIIGAEADVTANNLTNASAIGVRAAVGASNSLVLGSINGVNNAVADTNVGIGTTTPQQVLHANGTTEILSTGSGAGFKFRDRGSTSPADDWVWYSNGNVARFFRSGPGDLLAIKTNGNVGIGTNNPNAKLHVAGGNIYIAQPNSLIITSPNGTCWLITVSNSGVLSPIGVPCP